MWKSLMSAAVLALSGSAHGSQPDGNQGTQRVALDSLTEAQLPLYMLGVWEGESVAEYDPSPEELEQFRQGLAARLQGSGPPVDKETLARLAGELKALKERRELARGLEEQQQLAAPQEKAAKEQAVALEPEPVKAAEEPPEPPPVYYQVEIPAQAPSLGPKDAKVTLVVWCDLGDECQRSIREVRELLKEEPRDLRLVFRFFFKYYSASELQRAEAALAAHEQGRFWDYLHTRVYHGRELGMDLDRFQEAVGLRLFRGRVEAELAAGKALGLERLLEYGRAPIFFINGRQQVGYYAPLFKKLIQQEKARAERLLAEGTPPDQLYARLVEGGLKPESVGAPATPPAFFDLSRSPSRGPASAPITLIHFMSFDDPYSEDVAANLQMVEAEYAGKVRIVFKNLLLSSSPGSRPLAVAAMAAHEQGRFWDYYDLLLRRPKAHERKDLVAHARRLGLDLDRFQQALDSGQLAPQLEVDAREAEWLAPKGNPLFLAPCFVNRRRVQDPTSYTELRQIIDEQLEKVGAGR